MELFTLVKLHDPKAPSFSSQPYLVREMLFFCEGLLSHSQYHYSIKRLHTDQKKPTLYSLDQPVDASIDALFNTPQGPLEKKFLSSVQRITPENGIKVLQGLERQLEEHKLQMRQDRFVSSVTSFHLPHIQHTDHYYILHSRQLQFHYNITEKPFPFEEASRVSLHVSELTTDYEDALRALDYFRTKGEYKVLSIDESFRKRYNKSLDSFMARFTPSYIFSPKIGLPKKPKNSALDLSQIGMYIAHLRRNIEYESVRIRDIDQKIEDMESHYAQKIEQAQDDDELSKIMASYEQERFILYSNGTRLRQAKFCDENQLTRARAYIQNIMKRKD